jgi:predicted nucleic acid-binding protein
MRGGIRPPHYLPKKVLRGLEQRLSWPEIREILGSVRVACSVDAVTDTTHDRATAVAERYGLSMYDALIVPAALLAGCATLYSEDTQHVEFIDIQLTIRNPFLAE